MGTWEMTGGIKIVSEQNLGSYVTLQPTNTTNTFTPTTLKTIEQMFVDVEEPETYKNQAGFAPPTLKHKTYINMDSSNWQQGGVTTVVTPSAAPPPSFELLQPSNQEEEKMRRERNKLAAARCRKRRVDQLRAPPDANCVDALLREPAANEPERGAAGAWQSEHRRTFGISVMWSDTRVK